MTEYFASNMPKGILGSCQYKVQYLSMAIDFSMNEQLGRVATGHECKLL